MQDRKRPGWLLWTMLALVLVFVVYPVSFGPAGWLASPPGPWIRHGAAPPVTSRQYRMTDGMLARVYFPITYLFWKGPGWTRDAINWYAPDVWGKDPALFP